MAAAHASDADMADDNAFIGAFHAWRSQDAGGKELRDTQHSAGGGEGPGSPKKVATAEW